MKPKNTIECDKELPKNFLGDHILNCPIVFVFMGTKLPKYIIPSLRLNRKFSTNVDIYFLSNLSLDKKIEGINEVDIDKFYKSTYNSFFSSAKKNKWWDGFWNKTIERFFVLESFMKEYDFQYIIHMEIDNIGFDLVKTGELVYEMEEGIYFPTYMNKTSAASILFVNGISSIAHFNSFIKMNEEKSDMQLLYEYQTLNGGYAKRLPVDLKDENYKKLGIFDLFSLGHYLFGLDKRLMKTLNRNLKITNQEIYDSLIDPISEFIVKNNILYVLIEEKLIKVNNIHVHSKIHQKLIRPNYMDYILNSASKRRSVIVEFNYLEIIKNSLIWVLLKVKKIFIIT